MKFRVKVYEKPKHGDTKIVSKFLLFPKQLQDEIRWLEIVDIVCVFVGYSEHPWIEGFGVLTSLGWNEVRFQERH